MRLRLEQHITTMNVTVVVSVGAPKLPSRIRRCCCMHRSEGVEWLGGMGTEATSTVVIHTVLVRLLIREITVSGNFRQFHYCTAVGVREWIP
jgi:uncharacterized membrane protein